MKITRVLTRIMCGLALILGFTFSTAYAESFSGGQPANPQPDPAIAKNGLWVMYFYDRYEHIDQVIPLKDGTVSEPLKNIDHLAGERENVLTAYRSQLVGAHIRGYIHFEEAGTYVLRLQSNDGVQLHIGGLKLWTDPEIHRARWSRPLEYEVVEPGWYDFKLDYYQKKGTSALKLVWIKPGETEEVVVPPEAFLFNP